jgi:hypothetical protein
MNTTELINIIAKKVAEHPTDCLSKSEIVQILAPFYNGCNSSCPDWKEDSNGNCLDCSNDFNKFEEIIIHDGTDPERDCPVCDNQSQDKCEDCENGSNFKLSEY